MLVPPKGPSGQFKFKATMRERFSHEYPEGVGTTGGILRDPRSAPFSLQPPASTEASLSLKRRRMSCDEFSDAGFLASNEVGEVSFLMILVDNLSTVVDCSRH